MENQHFNGYPNKEFEEVFIRADLRPGIEYKKMVKDSFVSKIVRLPIKIDEILEQRYGVDNDDDRKQCILKIFSMIGNVKIQREQFVVKNEIKIISMNTNKRVIYLYKIIQRCRGGISRQHLSLHLQ